MPRKVNKYPNGKLTKQTIKNGVYNWILKRKPVISSYNFFKGRVKAPQLEKGEKAKDLLGTSHIDYPKLYRSFYFDLMDIMMYDFIMGEMVVYDKKKNLKFYLHMQKAPASVIAGTNEPRENLNRKTPLIDFRKTNYSFPKIMMELGYKNKPGALVKVPSYLYILLLDRIYNGVKHTKSSIYDMPLDKYFYGRKSKV